MPGCTVIEADLAEPDHQRAIRRLLDEYARDPMGNGGPLDAGALDRLIPGLSAHAPCVVFLALDGDAAPSAPVDGRAIGLAICFVGFSTFAGRPLINIHDFAVTARRRGHGVGRTLLAAVEERARRLGCCKLTLEVRHDNAPARRLYKRFGFGDFGDGPGDADLLFWSKTLR